MTANSDNELAPSTIVECGNGLRITIAILTRQTHGTRTRSLTTQTVMRVERDVGFTYDEFFDIVRPLSGLLSIVLHRQVEVVNLQLQPNYDPPTDARVPRSVHPIAVDPGVVGDPIDSEFDDLPPTLIAEAVDLAALLPGWMRVASKNRFPLDVAAPSKSSGPLQFEAVAVVNAAETLHRTLHWTPHESELAERVREGLKACGGFTSKERSKVASALQHQGVTLERRLVEIAQGLGHGAGAWLLNDQVAEWAKVTAVVRNALSHGFPTAHRVEEDYSALIGILQTTQALVRLRLLVEAGVPSGSALVTLLQGDHQYVALRQQSLADWRQLAASILRSS